MLLKFTDSFLIKFHLLEFYAAANVVCRISDIRYKKILFRYCCTCFCRHLIVETARWQAFKIKLATFQN